MEWQNISLNISRWGRKFDNWFLLWALIILVLTACSSLEARRTPMVGATANLSEQMTYEVLNIYPHDPQAFTQGLVYLDGFLFESTGLYGESSLRKVELETGQVLQQVNISPEYFAEGLTLWEDSLIQLTWREGTGFVYDQVDFALRESFAYNIEGWGLTHDGKTLIMSDGTSTLYFLDPQSFQFLDAITVTFQGEKIERLNELEVIRGEIFANIWQTDQVVRINPDSGEVTGWIDLGGILPPEVRSDETDVLNGIAHDPELDRLFVTGKRWPYLYEIRLVPILPEN